VNVNAGRLTALGAFQIAALALFLVVFVGRTVQLRVRKHINPITLSLGKRGLLGLIELALFIEVNLWALAVVEHALPGFGAPLPAWYRLQLIQSAPLQVVGVCLTILAFLICLLALQALGSSWRLGIDEKQPGELVTSGVYRFSRNPIYVFFDLYFMGTFLLNGTLLFLLFALFTIVNLHYQILQEERFLSQAHGSAYELYRHKTCRYATWRKALNHLKRPRRSRQGAAIRSEDGVTGPTS
jgi:protein-S-isoprenylcysteine O-methyltransferase Ste14